MVFTQLFSNNAVSLLKTGISASDTLLTVLAGQGALFPSPTDNEFFVVTLEDQAATQQEILHVFARNGDTFTIARGREGTSARSWTASAGNDTLVDHRVTADTLARLANNYKNPGFTSLTSYQEALDYILAQNPEAVSAAVTQLRTDISPVFDDLQLLKTEVDPLQGNIDDLQRQIIINNDYANPNFPAITSLSQAADYLLQGNLGAGGQEVDAPVTTAVDGSGTLITLPSNYKPGTTAVYIGGARQKRGVDFIENTANTLRLEFILTDAQIAEGQNLVVDYVVA
jgi:hypothetical protein